MKKRIVMEEFHLTVLVPPILPPLLEKEMAKILRSKRLLGRIRTAMTEVFAEFPGLAKTKIQITK